MSDIKEFECGYIHNPKKVPFVGKWDSVEYPIPPGLTPYPMWMAAKFAAHLELEGVEAKSAEEVEVKLKSKPQEPVEELVKPVKKKRTTKKK